MCSEYLRRSFARFYSEAYITDPLFPLSLWERAGVRERRGIYVRLATPDAKFR
jgi:hypothetical protein